MPAEPLWRQILARHPSARRKPRAEGKPEAAPLRVVLLEQGRSPSGDYLLRPWLARHGFEAVALDSRREPRVADLQPGDHVVIVRYLPSAWRQRLQAQREELAALSFFMDDDLFDPLALEGLPYAYAQKIERMALSHRAWLGKQGAALWVSTPFLAEKYQAWAPVLLPMAPAPELLAAHTPVRVAYHGTASHEAELRWLQPVLEAVQARCPSTHVEVFGDAVVHRLYRKLPRVSVLHPMSWENYLAYTAAHPCDIGLAPMLPGRFNRGRGPTKFFDYSRAGAAGLYADVAPYRGFVRDGVDGVLLPDDPDAWIEAIVAMASDAPRRAALVAAARQRAA